MPVLFIDRLLWVAQFEDSVYKNYYKNAVLYLPFSYRYFINKLNSTPSLVTKIFQEIQNKEIDDYAVNSIESVSDLIATILKFRCSHKRVVDDNFKLREHNIVGSGGYNQLFLDYLIQRTFQTMKRLKFILNERNSLSRNN